MGRLNQMGKMQFYMSLVLQVLFKKLRNILEDLMVGFISSSFIIYVEVSYLVA